MIFDGILFGSQFCNHTNFNYSISTEKIGLENIFNVFFVFTYFISGNTDCRKKKINTFSHPAL